MEQPTQEAERPELLADLASFAASTLERMGEGAHPRFFFSPGRVNLMGAHLDYNGGPVMPTAINRGTFLALRLRGDRKVRLTSTLEEGVVELDLEALPDQRLELWADYPIGVMTQMDRLAGECGAERGLSGFDLHFGGNLPIGAGLSSSASMCVGTAFALNSAWDLECSESDLVRAALNAERDHVGVQCGIMDPYAVGFSKPGALLWLDCKDASVEHLPFDSERLAIVVADTGVRRELAQSEFNLRVRQCAEAFACLREFYPGASCLRDVPLDALDDHGDALDPVHLKRARHVLEEVARTFEAREALERGDAAGFGARMTQAHTSMRDQYEVSCPELDLLVQEATAVPGILGARLTGAGFGGCVVILAEKTALEPLQERLASGFSSAFGVEPKVESFLGDQGPREITLPK